MGLLVGVEEEENEEGEGEEEEGDELELPLLSLSLPLLLLLLPLFAFPLLLPAAATDIESTRCAAEEEPSVVTARACVSPLVKRAEPCVRGSNPALAAIGLTSLGPRPSERNPESSTAERIAEERTFLKAELKAASEG